MKADRTPAQKRRKAAAAHTGGGNGKASAEQDPLKGLVDAAFEPIVFNRHEAVLSQVQAQATPKVQDADHCEVQNHRFSARRKTFVTVGAAAAAAAVLVFSLFFSVLLDLPHASPVRIEEKPAIIVIGEQSFAAVQLGLSDRTSSR